MGSTGRNSGRATAQSSGGRPQRQITKAAVEQEFKRELRLLSPAKLVNAYNNVSYHSNLYKTNLVMSEDHRQQARKEIERRGGYIDERGIAHRGRRR